MEPNLKREICDEVKRQMQPIETAVAEVTRQNGEQSTLLASLGSKVGAIDSRLRALWGNGTGPPGYLENARAVDTDRYKELLAVVTTLKAEQLKEEGKEELRADLERTRLELEKHSEVTKTAKLNRWKIWLSIIGGMAGGSWVLTLIHPIATELARIVLKALESIH